jgi:hypothetical protein
VADSESVRREAQVADNVRRIKIREVARFGEMTIFETDDLEARTMKLIYNSDDNSWRISEKD